MCFYAKMPIAPVRIFDPYVVIRKALRHMRSYNLPERKKIWEEDIILNRLDESECAERVGKWRHTMAVESTLKSSNQNFPSFNHDLPYLS